MGKAELASGHEGPLLSPEAESKAFPCVPGGIAYTISGMLYSGFALSASMQYLQKSQGVRAGQGRGESSRREEKRRVSSFLSPRQPLSSYVYTILDVEGELESCQIKQLKTQDAQVNLNFR